MKKHFLRTLVVLLMACLGVGVLAACGEKKKDKDPEPTTTYTVQFSLGDPSHAAEGVTAPASQTEKAVGATITLTTPAAAENWKFDGWYTKNGKVNGTTYTVNAADAVGSTITLTAHWADDTPAPAPATYTVTYALGDHADAEATVPAQATATEANQYKVTLPAAPKAAKGYEFAGWQVGADVKEAEAEITVSESITVTATWTAKTYTVKFNLGSGGSSTDDTTLTKQATGTEVDIPKVNAFKGYELTGWQLQDKEKTLAADATKYTVSPSDAAAIASADSEIVFIAQYDYIEYTVKFVVTKPEGVEAEVQGTHADTTVTVEDMPHRRVTFPSVSLEGYVVTGWKLSTTGATQTGATYQVKDTDLPENTAAHEITFTAQWGEPDYTGVWTDYIINGYKVGSDKYDLYFEITIQSDEANGFDVVWKEYYTDDDFVDHATYVFGNFKKEGSSYKMTAEGTTYTLQVNAKYQLVLGKTFTEGDPFNATLEGDHDPLPAVRITEPAAGTYYVRYTRSDYTETKYTFAAEGNDTIKTSASGSEIVISYKAVGSYLVISGDGVATHALYKNGNLYYTTLLNNDETDAQLTTEEPPLTPETADITFEFTSNPNRSGVKPQGMPAEDFTGTHRVGQSFNLPNAPTDENGAREFVWWETANGDHYAAGASYEVKAADAEAVMGDGFNPQVVGYKIVFTAEWTMTYKVEYISLTEDGTKDTAVSCGTDPETYKTNQSISIIEDEPTKGDATFLGWKLYLYNADQETYTPVRAVADILYKKDTDHATYTPNNSENKNAEKEPVALVFAAQWEADAPTPATDINGVWSSEDYILTVKVEGSTGHAIVKSTDGSTYTYYALTGADSTYSGRNTSGQTITITPAGSDLSVKIASGGFGAFVTYTRTSDLPAALEIEGTYKGADDWASVTINFTDKTVEEEEEATFENVGDYIVIKGQFTNYLVYKDGEKFYVVAGDSTLELKKQGGIDPQPVADITGTWTNEETTIVIDGDKALVVTGGTQYTFYTLTEEADHYSATKIAGNGMSASATFTPTDGGFIYAPKSGANITFTEKKAIAHLTLEGEYKSTDGTVVINFTQKTISLNMGSLQQIDSTFTDVGEYIVIETDVMDFFVYKVGEQITAWCSNGTYQFTATAQPQPSTYDVSFDLNDDDGPSATGAPANADNQPAGAYAIPEQEPTREGYDFLGWTLIAEGTGTVYKYGTDDDEVTITDADITLYAKWESNLPTVTVQAGDATGSGDLGFQFVASDDTYNITLPENTVYTAPAGKYFRGYTYGGKTYFPGEQITGIAHKATVEITLVWENLAQNATEPVEYTMLKWFTDGATEVFLNDGMTLKFVAKMTAADGTLADWSTIFPDLNMTVGGTNFWLHFRVDNFIATADSNDSNTNDTLKAMKKSSNFNASTYRALYTSDDTAVIHAVTATLKDNKLTYQYDVYASTDTTMQNAVCTTVFEAESSVAIQGLGIKFFYADITSVTEASYTMVNTVSENQNPTAEAALTVESKAGYNAGVWSSVIRKGETLELTGKAEIGTDAEGQKGWFGFVSALYTGSRIDIVRMDNYVIGAGVADPQNSHGLNYKHAQTGGTTDQLAQNEQLDASIKVDWSTATQIVITMKINAVVTTWTITGATSLAEEYLFSFGLDHCTATFTNIVRTHAAG